MIVACGEALIDFVPMTAADGSRGYRPCVGGSPYNTAVAMARLGAATGFLARLSTDFFGQMLRDHLTANGIDIGLSATAGQPTTLGFVSLDQGDEPQFAFYSNGAADRSLVPGDLPDTLPESVRCLQFGSISLMQEPSATTLAGLMRREAGHRVISLDPNVRPGLIPDRIAWRTRLEGWIALADIVKVSAADLAWLYPGAEPLDRARAWLRSGPRLVAVTFGADRSVGLFADRSVVEPAQRVTVSDAVGAGDTFHAGLLASLDRDGLLAAGGLSRLDSTSVARALRLGARAAAITVTRPGADPPTWEEVVARFGPL